MAAGDLALRIIITATGGQAIAELGAVRDATRGLSSNLDRNMKIAGLAIAVIGIASIKAAGDFQQQMLHIQALAEGTGPHVAKQMQDMSASILAMSAQVGQMPVTMAQAMFQIVSGLIPANEQMQALYYSGILASTGMADQVQVAKILAQVMHTFGLSASEAANDMTVAVTYGQMTMTDYAGAIGLVALNGKSAGISFNETNAALDVLTHVFHSSAQGARNLNQMYTQMELGMDAMAGRASKMGLSFSEAHFKTLDLAGQISYLTQVTHGNDQELQKLIGGGVYAYRSFIALRNGASDYTLILGKLAHAQDGIGAAQEAWGTTQQGFNVQLSKGQAALQVLLITIGNALLPVVGNIIGAMATWTGQLVGWLNSGHAVNDALTLTGKYSQIVLPILAGLAALILSVVVPAFLAWAGALLMNPITWVVLAVVGLTAAFIHFYQTNAGFKAFMDQVGNAFKQLGGWIMTNVLPALRQFGDWLQKNVLPPLEQIWSAINQNFVPTLKTLANYFMNNILPILKDIGSYLLQTFGPVWTQLQEEWKNIILPALKQLWAAFQNVLPVLKFIASVIGVVLITAIGLLWAAISGIVKGLGGFLQGLMVVFGGLVQFFTGIVQFIWGIGTFIYDFLTGNWKKLGQDAQQIWQGIVNIFGGIFHAIGGLFQGLWGLVTGALQGFWDGIVGFFKNLWDKLTGHSIIPDMIKSIVSVFAGLPKSALDAIGGLLGKLMDFFGGLATKAVTWGANIIKQLASGIIGNIGSAIGGAFSSLGGFIHDHLPHSPAKLGPLRELEYQGSQIPGQIASGVLKGVPRLQSALRTSLTLPALTQQNAFALQSPNNQNQQMNMTINLDGRQLTQALGVRMAKEIRIQGNVRGR